MLEQVGLRGSPGGSRRKFLQRRKGRMLAALAAALALPSPTLPATTSISIEDFDTAQQVSPAMWVISDRDTTIFLFGTFHALDRSTDWFSPTIRAALSASHQLVLETIVPTSPFELHGSLARHQLAGAPVAGAPVVSNANSPAFVDGARQAIDTGRSIGLSVDSGADAVLRRNAEAQGKVVEGLESFDFQLGMFKTIAKLSARAAAPREAIDQKAMMHRLRDAWKSGEASEFAAMLGTIRDQSPETYKILFADRNQRWADWIARRLDQPGVAFVAVGAGHLTGTDSIQVNLARRGIRSNRVS